jgi:hypothetical protein
MKTEIEILEELENDFDTYPLPICFDPMEERREFYHRRQMLKVLAKEKFQLMNSDNDEKA